MPKAANAAVPAWAAAAIAALSILYAIVFLGFVRGHPEAHGAAALANAFIGISGILVTVVAVALGARVGGARGTWIALFGSGWGLLSAVHGVFAAIAEAQGIAVGALSPTDPNGFATFGLAGIWVLVVGSAARVPAARPGWLAPLAIVNGIDLIALFLSAVAGAEIPILVTGGLASVILGPAFWIGIAIRLAE